MATLIFDQRPVATGGGSGPEFRYINAGGLSREAPAYTQLIADQPITRADVDAGVELLVSQVAADNLGATADRYIGITINGQPDWARYA